jgi:S1-C subfamily serine protease
MPRASVNCPSCRAALAVEAQVTDGTVLQCPQCGVRFATRVTQAAAAAARRVERPPAPRAQPSPRAQPARPAARAQAAATVAPGSDNRLLLYIGGASCAVIAVAMLAIAVMIGRGGPGQGNDVDTGETLVARATGVAGDAAPAAVSNGGISAAASAPMSPAPTAPAAGSPPNTAQTPPNPTPPNPTPPNPTPPSPAPPNPAPQAPIGAMSPTSPAAVSTSSGAAPPPTVSPAPVPQPAVAPPPASSPGLAYRWNSGEEYGYFFTIKADVAGVTDEATGMAVFTANNEPAPREFAAHEKSGQGSGTGFVVTSDGYLVTCAHVVEGSTKIEVQLQGRSYPGQVTAFDKKHDLAVVRIAATNLPVLPLANSDAVELAQEVRAVGFPLSDVLGESVKITRGSIAGVIDSAGRKLFQVDASINPGNSGGPIVNEMGQVVGVASAKLAGEDIDGVGLVVPSNELQSLLRTKNVGFQTAQPASRLEGPELARRVTPGVALIKVTVGPGGFGSVRRSILKFTGHVTAHRKVTAGGRPQLSTPPMPEVETGKVLVSELGEVVESTGNVQLPYLLGGLGAFPIEPLAPAGEKTWATRRLTVMTQVIGDTANDRMSMRFRRRGLRPAPRQQAVAIVPALEAASYELVSTSGDRVTIKKRYVFTTLQKEGTPPVAQLTGEGTITFNQRSGFPETMEYKASLVRSTGNISVTIPLTMSWRRVEQKVLDDGRARAAAAREAAKNAPKSAARSGVPPGAKPTPAQVDSLVAQLAAAKDAGGRSAALNELDRMQPIDERRAAVTKTAEPLMRDTTNFVRDAAIRVMGTWGTKDNVPALLAMLDQLDTSIRRVTIASLAKIPDRRSAEKLAGLIPESSDRVHALQALKKMGSLAEPAVIKLLKHGDKHVRKYACDLLAELGGAKSIAALKALLRSDRDSYSRMSAERALKKLTGK